MNISIDQSITLNKVTFLAFLRHEKKHGKSFLFDFVPKIYRALKKKYSVKKENSRDHCFFQKCIRILSFLI